MTLDDRDYVVDAVPADGTDHPIDVGILLRGAVYGDDLFDSHGLDTQPEPGALNAVSIPDHKAKGSVEWERPDKLLRCPCGRWKPGRFDVWDLPPYKVFARHRSVTSMVRKTQPARPAALWTQPGGATKIKIENNS